MRHQKLKTKDQELQARMERTLMNNLFELDDSSELQD